MKYKWLFVVLLFSIFNSVFSQNSDDLRTQAMQFYEEGKFTESLKLYNKIKDKETLENTDVNLYKANLKDIINYRFVKKTKLKDSLYVVYIKTNVLKSQGIYDAKSNQYTVPPVYDTIYFQQQYYSKYLIAHKNNLATLLNIETGKTIIPLGNYYINRYGGYITVDGKNKSHDDYPRDGVISVFDYNGNLLFKDLNTFELFDSNYFKTKNQNNKYQLIDIKTKKIVLDDCDYIQQPTGITIENDIEYNNVWLPFQKNNKNYLYKITKNGIEDTHQFDTYVDMYSQYNIFENSLSKIINIKDNATSCPVEEHRSCFNSDYTIVKKGDKYGIFDVTKDKFYKEPIYDSISTIGNTLYQGKWINLIYGEEICMPRTTAGRYISTFIFKKNNLFGLLSPSGKVIVEANYDEIIDYEWAEVYYLRKGTKWGFVGVQKDDMLVEPEFDFITYLSNNENLAGHKNKKTIEFLRNGTKAKPADKKNNQVGKEYIETDKSFYSYSDLKELEKADRIIFKKDGKYGLDDLGYNEILPAKYSYIEYGIKNTYIVQTDTLQGLIDHNGKELIPVKYSSINRHQSNNPNLFFVKFDNGLEAIFNVEGKMIYPPKIKQVEGSKYDKKSNTEYIHVNELYYSIIEKETNKQDKFYKDFVLKIKDEKVEALKLDTSYSKFLHSNFLVYGSNYSQIGFYNLSNCKIIKPEYGEHIIDDYTHNRIIAQKGKDYDTVIDSLGNVSALEHPIFEIKNGYYFYKDGDKTGVMDKNLKAANFKYPVLKIMIDTEHAYTTYNYKDKARHYFKFNPKTNSGKNGLIHFDGTILIQPEKYDDIGLFYFGKGSNNDSYYNDNSYLKKYLNDVFVGTTNISYNLKRKTLISSKNEKIAEFEVKKNENWDFSRLNNTIVIKSSDSVKLYNISSKKIDIKIKANGFNEDNDLGYTILTFDYISNKNKYAKYDCNGKFIRDTIVGRKEGYYSSSNENYILIRNKKYGALNSKGKQGIPFVYDHLRSKNSKLFICKNNNVYGVVDAENQTLIDKKYQDIQWAKSKEVYYKRIEFSGFMLKEKNKWGLMSLNLKTLLPTKFDTIQVRENCITAKKDSLVSAYDFSGKILFTVAVDSIKMDLNNNFHLYKNGKEVFRDKNGDIVDESPYTSWEDRIKSKYSQKIEAKYYLSKNGTIIYKTAIVSVESIEVAEDFMGEDLEYLKIKDENNLYGLYTEDLKPILPFAYNEIIILKNKDFVLVHKNNKYGVVNYKNEILIPLEYDKINNGGQGFFKCIKNDKEYYITPRNKIIHVEKVKKKSVKVN